MRFRGTASRPTVPCLSRTGVGTLPPSEKPAKISAPAQDARVTNSACARSVIDFGEESLKRRILDLVEEAGLNKARRDTEVQESRTKESIRELHRAQRRDKQSRNRAFLARSLPRLIQFFAAGNEICPAQIRPEIERIYSGTWQSDLFRLASLTWSVPVSNGFGRRLRYLVWDRSNEKLIGLFAIGDPVFNLSVRDRLIRWNAAARSKRLVNLMDAYVLGSVPPYNQLLAGKMVACLVRSREVHEEFYRVYGETTGLISGEKKNARLLAVTTSSSMGRSSVYNRLSLAGSSTSDQLATRRGGATSTSPTTSLCSFAVIFVSRAILTLISIATEMARTGVSGPQGQP